MSTRRYRLGTYTLWLVALIFCAACWYGVYWGAREAASATKHCESTQCLKRAILWQRHDRARLRHRLAVRYHRDAAYAIRIASAAFGLSVRDMRTIAQCESGMGLQTTAEAGSGASGIFQFLPSTFARTPFAAFDVFDPIANSLAAAWLVTKDHGWREWSCSSITGVR